MSVKDKRLGKLSDAEIGYIAGMIDGEGYVAAMPVVMRIKGRTPYWRFETRVIVTNTKLELIKWLRAITGCGVVYERKVKGRNLIWNWQVTTNECGDILRLTLPYLKVKEKQAKLILQLRERINNHKVGGIRGWYYPLSEDELDCRHAICNEIAMLNKRRRAVLGLSPSSSREQP